MQQSQQSQRAPLPGYHAPVPTNIPLAAVQSLIPRLATTINDIDSFKNLIAAGNADGTLPNWDTLLQRYSVLLSRINALSAYLAQPPPAPLATPQNPKPAKPAYPALKTAIVHPLHALPTDNVANGANAEAPVNPLAPQIYFQAINTMPMDPSMIPPVPIPGQAEDTDDADMADHAEGSSAPKIRALNELRKLDSRQLDAALRALRERLTRETQASHRLEDEMKRLEQEGEINWAMRIEEDGAEEGGEDGDDLFGGDDDGDAVMVDKPDQTSRSKQEPDGPRKGWGIADFVRYMDNGAEPVKIEAPSEALA